LTYGKADRKPIKRKREELVAWEVRKKAKLDSQMIAQNNRDLAAQVQTLSSTISQNKEDLSQTGHTIDEQGRVQPNYQF
jgi:hypothetical protein